MEWLLTKNPRSVLDLGAGSGALVAELNAAGVSASGIENSRQALERAKEAGLPIVDGQIDSPSTAIPSADWITIRHVLHHLEQPARVLLRASAAARVGIVAAEPLADEGFPRYEWTRRLEALTRRLDRESGMNHGPDLTASQLVPMFPSDWSVEVRAFAPMVALPSEEVLGLIDKAARGEILTVEDSKEKTAILAAARAGLVSPAGSLVVMATRGPE